MHIIQKLRRMNDLRATLRTSLKGQRGHNHLSKASLKRYVLSLDLKISRVADWVISGGSLLYSDGVKCEKASTPIGHSVVFWDGEQIFG